MRLVDSCGSSCRSHTYPLGLGLPWGRKRSCARGDPRAFLIVYRRDRQTSQDRLPWTPRVLGPVGLHAAQMLARTRSFDAPQITLEHLRSCASSNRSCVRLRFAHAFDFTQLPNAQRPNEFTPMHKGQNEIPNKQRPIQFGLISLGICVASLARGNKTGHLFSCLSVRASFGGYLN